MITSEQYKGVKYNFECVRDKICDQHSLISVHAPKFEMDPDQATRKPL